MHSGFYLFCKALIKQTMEGKNNLFDNNDFCFLLMFFLMRVFLRQMDADTSTT